MNVLYLTMNPNRQSTTVPTEGWFRLLPERGLKPVLVSRERRAFDQWARCQGIPAYQNPLPFPDKRRPWQLARALWQLRSIAKRHRIELIHCNEQDVYPIGSYLARLLKVPVVVSVHFTMGRGFCQWAFGGNRAPDKMFFVSRSNLEACRPNLTGIVPSDRWRVLHNGLNLEDYQVDDAKAAEFRSTYKLHGCRLVGVACAIRERKQIEHLFRAMVGVHVDLRLKVVLAGGEVPGERPEYSNEVVKMGKSLLGDRFIYVGHLEDLRGMLNALELFVNTSREESFGIAPLEALACGCPVVGYDSKAVDEVVLPDGGEIVEQDNVDLLRETLEKWLADAALLSGARAGARRQAERFDIRTLADQLWDEYTQLLGERNRVRHASALQ